MDEPLVWLTDLQEAEVFLRKPERAKQPISLDDEHLWLENAIASIRSTLADMSRRFLYEIAPPPPPGQKRHKITLRELHRELLKKSPDDTSLERRVGFALSHISKYGHSSANQALRTDVENWLNISNEFFNVMVSKIEATAIDR